MCIRDRSDDATVVTYGGMSREPFQAGVGQFIFSNLTAKGPVSYTHLRAHETVLDLVCRLLLEKKK